MNKELKLGIIGLDTSHVIVFSEEFNNPAAKHHLKGAKVVAAWPGGSHDLESSIGRVPGYTKDLREKYGVQILDSIEAVVAASDAILHTSLDGRVHLEQFQRIAAAAQGKPVFVDKPFALRTIDARAIFAIAQKFKVPVFTSSSLRFTGALTRVVTPETRPLVKGAQFHGPAALEPTNPGFFWYGIHPIEMLYTTMGRGCRSVRCLTNEHFDVVTGIWGGDRLGSVHFNRTGQLRIPRPRALRENQRPRERADRGKGLLRLPRRGDPGVLPDRQGPGRSRGKHRAHPLHRGRQREPRQRRSRGPPLNRVSPLPPSFFPRRAPVRRLLPPAGLALPPPTP
jgi:hypothetical protein